MKLFVPVMLFTWLLVASVVVIINISDIAADMVVIKKILYNAEQAE